MNCRYVMHSLSEGNVILMEIPEILRNREKILQSIREKQRNILKDLQAKDDLIQSLALPSPPFDKMPSGTEKHDLTDFYLRYQKSQEVMASELFDLLEKLTVEEKMIHRVWKCYHVLTEPYFSILTRLYVENELYRVVECEFGRSHNTFERFRKDALESVMDLCNSGVSDAQLERMKGGKKETEQKPSVLPEQLKLDFAH